MVIFFTVSKKEKEKRQAFFDQLIKLIQDDGHKVLSLEVQNYSDLLDIKKAEKKEKKISVHNQYVKKALEMSDAAIFEGSRYSFKLGQEVQMALAKKIPVLMISDDIDYSESVQDPCFYSHKYKTLQDVKKFMNEFWDEVRKNHEDKRMNIFLHNKHLNYLDWYVERNPGTNRSQIIRDVIDELIEKQENYD